MLLFPHVFFRTKNGPRKISTFGEIRQALRRKFMAPHTFSRPERMFGEFFAPNGFVQTERVSPNSFSYWGSYFKLGTFPCYLGSMPAFFFERFDGLRVKETNLSQMIYTGIVCMCIIIEATPLKIFDIVFPHDQKINRQEFERGFVGPASILRLQTCRTYISKQIKVLSPILRYHI